MDLIRTPTNLLVSDGMAELKPFHSSSEKRWTQRHPHRVGQNVDATQHPLARIGMKPDFLCRHGLLPSRSLARRSLFDHAHDVAFLRDDEIFAVDFDLGSRPLSEQHSVADFDIERL